MEPRFDVQPKVGDHFAWLRTQMAMQRTLMAATRTAVSLIGFGFTVAQFFEKVTKAGLGHFRPEAPRNLGMVLIAAGVVSLAIFVWQARVATRYMRGPEFAAIAVPGDHSMRGASDLTAYAVMAVGVAAFVMVFMRL